MSCQKVDMQSADAKHVFNESLLNTGFAVVTNHGISAQRIDSVYTEWCGFLKQLQGSPELREKYLRDMAKFDGYFPLDLAEVAKTAEVRDLKQYFQLYVEGRYPRDEGVTEEAMLLFEDFLNLGSKLLSWIDEKLDDTARARLSSHGIKSLVETLSRERTMMRILHYPAYEAKDSLPGQVRAAPHEDINWITVLPAGSTRGLQLCVDGTTWVDVPYEKDSIVINIGDMLQELTEGQFRSTTHRVIKHPGDPQGAERMSIPCFIHPKADIYLSPAHPTAEHFLNERLAKLYRLQTQ
eukprot:m.27916 g.27916  ORF g.27916 m.27916 type:complete len:295 (-) comp15834_c1_seq1:201-1085(-)